jgi:hypothetical protein
LHPHLAQNDRCRTSLLASPFSSGEGFARDARASRGAGAREDDARTFFFFPPPFAIVRDCDEASYGVRATANVRLPPISFSEQNRQERPAERARLFLLMFLTPVPPTSSFSTVFSLPFIILQPSLHLISPFITWYIINFAVK